MLFKASISALSLCTVGLISEIVLTSEDQMSVAKLTTLPLLNCAVSYKDKLWYNTGHAAPDYKALLFYFALIRAVYTEVRLS